MTAERRHLLIARCGPSGCHHKWLPEKGVDASFDVLLSFYDAPEFDLARPGIRVEHRPGHKIAGYGSILKEYASLISQYSHVALFDDDIETDASTIQALFAVADQHDFRICQPALTHDSFFSYAAFLQNPNFTLRYVNYIEMMCPVFRSDVLLALRPLFDLGYESGIDLVWCNMGSPTPVDFAVIDTVAVRHSRPVAGRMAENGFVAGRTYNTDISDVLRQFGLPWLSCCPYEALKPTGKKVSGRAQFILSALSIVPAIWGCQRDDWKMRLRGIAVHFKHLLFRSALNIPIDWPSGKKYQISPPNRLIKKL